MPFLYKRDRSPYYYIGLSRKEKEILNTNNFSTKEKTRKAAEIILKQTKQDLSVKLQYRPSQKNININDAFELYKEDRENTGKPLREKTIESYTTAKNKLIEIVGNKYVNNYTKTDYHQFVTGLKGSNNTKSVYTRRIYALFNWMVRENILQVNPFKRIQERQKEFEIKTEKEIEKILNYAKETKFYWIVKFQLVSAFRLGEMLSMKKKDIKQDIIKVMRKGGVPNYIPITNRMKKLLTEMPLPVGNDDYVFPYSEDAVYRFYGRLREKLKIQITSHDLRKYCLSEMANAGVRINYVKDYAGHTDIKTTMKYYVRSDKLAMADEINEKLE